jgi:hypothetical protein
MVEVAEVEAMDVLWASRAHFPDTRFDIVALVGAGIQVVHSERR